MSAGMQLPSGPTYINWSPEQGNVGYGVQSLVDQLRTTPQQGGLSGYGVPQVPVSGGLSAEELGALRGGVGGVGAPAMGGGLTALESAGGGGFPNPLAPFSAAKGALTNPLSGGLKGIAGRVGPAIGYYTAGQVAGGVNNAFGGFEGGYQGDVTAGLKGIGAGAAVGSMIAPGPGTVIGAAIGSGLAAKNAFDDLQSVNAYSDVVDKFNNVDRHMPKSMQDDARQAALRIHNDKSIPLSQKATVLSQLIDQMKQAKAVNKQATTIPTATKAQLKIQAQMADSMQKIGAGVISNGDAAAASIRAGIPNADPRLQPLMENDAMTREQRGREIVAAQTGATYIQPQIDQMTAQLQQLVALRQQLSQQGSGGSLTQSLAAASGK